MKFSMTEQEKQTFKYRWLFNRGDLIWQVWLYFFNRNRLRFI